MIKRIGLVAGLFLSAISCEQQNNLTIPEDRMIELLLDAHILEATLMEASNSVKDSVSEVMYQQFYTIHGIKPEEFRKNLEIIQNDPELTNKIYKRLQDTVMVRAAKAEEQKKSEKSKKDWGQKK